MNRRLHQGLSTLCAVALTAALLPAAAFAAPSAAPAPAPAEPATSLPALDLNNLEVLSLETSASCEEALAPFALAETDAPVLAAGEHAQWIDRVQLPAYARTFYDVLVEASDNDGYRDYLIGDAYYDARAAADGTYRPFSNAASILVGSFVAPSTQTLQAAQEAAFAALAAFDRDHPEVFWLSGSIGLATRWAGLRVELYLVLWSNDGRDIRNASCPNEYTIKHGIWSRDRQVRAILQGVPAGASQEQAVRLFNQWLTRNNQYNTAPSFAVDNDPWECLSALEGRAGSRGPVCEGYARALKVLCDRAAIPCALVDGTAIEPLSGASGGHMWNYVQLAGSWYGADVTWNDPAGGSGKVSGAESDTWLLVGGQQLIEGKPFLWSHPVENRVYQGGIAFTNGPALSATAFDGARTPSSPVRITLPAVGAEPQKTRLTSVALSKSSFTYSGKMQRPTVTVRAGGQVLAPSSYTATFSAGCKKPGAYRVTVTGRGSYAGSVSASFKIVKPPVAKPTAVKLKAGKKKLAVSWKRAAGKVTGYQVQYSTSKKFTKKTTKKATVKVTSKLAKKKTLSKTVKKLKAKKTYYVRVRTFYKVGGSTFYSSWTKAKKVRVK